MSEVFIPHRYQLTGIARLVRHANFALFLDPGMGKTSMVYRAFVSLRRMGRVKKAMLVVAPERPMYTTWPGEASKWTFTRGLKVRVLHGPNKLKELNSPADVYVINPAGLKWLFTVALKGKRNWPFDMLVIDESGKFRNPDSRRLALMKPRLKRFDRRVILNGTPAPNSLLDLWAQFLLVDCGEKFGRKITQFRWRYFKQGGFKGREWEIQDDQAKQNIYRRARDMCLVMEASDHLKMPRLKLSTVKVELPPDAMRAYLEAENDLFTVIDESEIEFKSAATASGACRQIANGALYEPVPLGEKAPPSSQRPFFQLHEAKLEALVDLSDELAGKPMLIAYNFHHDLPRIREALRKAFNVKHVPHIGSGVSLQEGAKLEKLWNAGKLRWLLGSPDAISHGVNLQYGPGADIVWFGPTWNLETYLQYIQRIYRQGFKGWQVRVHHLVASGTIDELMMKRLDAKERGQQDFKDALKDYRNSKRELHSARP